MPRVVYPHVYKVSRVNTSTMEYSESVVGFVTGHTLEQALEAANAEFKLSAPIVQLATAKEIQEFYKESYK